MVDFNIEKHLKKLEAGKNLLDLFNPSEIDEEGLRKFMERVLIPDEYMSMTAEQAFNEAVNSVIRDIKIKISQCFADFEYKTQIRSRIAGHVKSQLESDGFKVKVNVGESSSSEEVELATLTITW